MFTLFDIYQLIGR